MAQDQILLELVSPEKVLLSRHVDMVVVPGEDGDFGVLPRHAPLLSTLRHGVISVYDGGVVSQKFSVSGGLAEVTGARCTLLGEFRVHLSDEVTPTDDPPIVDVGVQLSDSVSATETVR